MTSPGSHIWAVQHEVNEQVQQSIGNLIKQNEAQMQIIKLLSDRVSNLEDRLAAPRPRPQRAG